MIFAKSSVWQAIPDNADLLQIAELLDDLYHILNAASHEEIPRIHTSKYYPKLWWSPELRQSKQKRE